MDDKIATKRIWGGPGYIGALVLITLLAAWLRLQALDKFPPGLYHDEAYNGLDALSVLQGHAPLFFEANNGREPLFIYVEAASVALWGRSPGALRLVSALFGILTIPVIYGLGKTLFDRRVGLLAATLAATTVWTLNLSRVAFRAVSMPPLMALTLALLWHGLSRRRVASMVWAGILYGLTFYTYLAARFSLLALLLFIIYTLLWHRRFFWLRGWGLFGLVGLLVAAPLGIYFVTHWSSIMGRADQVSILNNRINGGDVGGTLLRHIWRAALSFFYRGDFNPRHNVPLRPIFDPFIASALLGGVLIALRRARRAPAYGLSLIWLGTMLMPTILAEDTPHMLRASGILPVLFLFPALGLDCLWHVLARTGWGRLGIALLVLALVLSSAFNINAYASQVRSEVAYYAFEAGATEAAVEVNRFLGSGWKGAGLVAPTGEPMRGRAAYLAPGLWRWTSVQYLCPPSEALRILPDPGEPAPRKPGDEDVLLLLSPIDDNQAALAFLPRGRLISIHEGARERGDLERTSRLLYITYRSQLTDAMSHNVQASWQEGIQLAGYHLDTTHPNALGITLYWQATLPITSSYTVFCHVLYDGTRIGQHDGLPAGGYYTTTQWRPGDLVEDRHEVALSQNFDPQHCQILVGLYRLQTMQRLTLLDEMGQATQQTTLTLD
jgi:4-amino-4-deoxy-L-arabinose transferase-like glycosyltransferase